MIRALRRDVFLEQELHRIGHQRVDETEPGEPQDRGAVAHDAQAQSLLPLGPDGHADAVDLLVLVAFQHDRGPGA